MNLKLTVYFFAAAIIGIQGCRKTDTLQAAPVTQTDDTNTTTGLRINAVGDYGIYQILDSKGGFAQVLNNSVEEGGTINTGNASGSRFQKWKITRVSTYQYTIKNIGSGLYARAYDFNGTPILVQGKATNADNQEWTLTVSGNKTYKVVSKSTGLAVTGADNQALLTLADFTGTPAQGWAYNELPKSDTLDTGGHIFAEGIYTMQSSADVTGKAAGIHNASMSTGAFVSQKAIAFDKNEQKWQVVKQSGGYYKILSVYNGHALDIIRSATNTRVVMNKLAVKDSQLWQFIKASNGAYGIVNKENGYCLNLRKAASSTDHDFLTLDIATYTANHGWVFKPVNAMKVDTVTTHSTAMNKDIQAVVITPSNYKTDGKKYPVMYLLHGHGGNHLDYITNAPDVRNYADKYGMIIVCADGNRSSWYLNATRNPASWQYETYISSELVSYVDSHYRTIRSNKGRGIVGLSMGGHGALYNAFKHQDVFGACGSMSGCVDIARVDTIGLRIQYNINDRIGPKSGATAAAWTENSVLYMTDLVKNSNLAIQFDTDETDGFYPMNNDLAAKLTAQGTPYTYTHDHLNLFFGHTWAYWAYKLPSHFEFVSNKLDKAQ